jgi:S-adenosylmethionine decarboxylase
VCLNDKAMLEAMARAAERAGANVISQVRYKFGHDSPPGFTAFVLLDESHCSCHTYADLGLVALDVFTCGNTDPRKVLDYIREEINLGECTMREVERFDVAEFAFSPSHSLELANGSRKAANGKNGHARRKPALAVK